MYKGDRYMDSILSYLMKKHGVDAAYRMIDPLRWYIITGRASIDFIDRLMEVKPFVIGRLLAKEGSYDDAISRVKTRFYGKERTW